MERRGLERKGEKLKCLIHSRQQASDKCLPGRSWKYPVGSVEYPESIQISKLRQQRRIDQSMAIEWRGAETRYWRIETHKYKDSVGVRFPILYHLLILFSRHFQVHGENMARAISKIRYGGVCLTRRRLRWVLAKTYLGKRNVRNTS